MKLFFSALCCPALLFFSDMAFGESFKLPFWRSVVEALGYQLPNPFGVSVSYLTLAQSAQVNQIDLQDGLFPKKMGLSSSIAAQEMSILTLKADVWLLPFLNVYGLVGQTRGESNAKVTVNWEKFDLFEMPFKINLDGNLYGAGFTLVAAKGSWFSLFDLSQSYTQLTAVDGAVATTVMSPRVGIDFSTKGLPLRLWVGGMYQHVAQTLGGNLSNIGFDLDGRYRVEQSLTSPWNAIGGAQYQWNDHLSALFEVGWGKRTSAFASLDFRF